MRNAAWSQDPPGWRQDGDWRKGEVKEEQHGAQWNLYKAITELCGLSSQVVVQGEAS